MASKSFPVEDVLTVVTGIMLKRGADFHGVMDHLYPGIMTIGCAAMRKTASEEIMRQHPSLRGFSKVDPKEIDRYLNAALITLGATIDIDGPHEVSEAEISEAFATFGKAGA